MFEKHTTVEIRLDQYRQLRVSNLSEAEILQKFSEIKILPRYIDYWTPETWPNPFEIIEYGYFCTTGISLLMYHLLGHLGYINSKETEWKVISNNMNGNDGAVFVYNNKIYNVFSSQAIDVNIAEEDYVQLAKHNNLYIPLV